MLRVTVEYIPHGDESKKEVIGEIKIINNGKNKCKPDFGDYDIIISTLSTKSLEQFRVLHHRRSAGFWRLIKTTLQRQDQIQFIKQLEDELSDA